MIRIVEEGIAKECLRLQIWSSDENISVAIVKEGNIELKIDQG